MASEAPPDDGDEEVFGLRVVAVEAADAGGRIDKLLAERLPEFSRARLQALIAEGRVSHGGAVLTSGSAKAAAGDYRVEVPAPVAAEPQGEDIPLSVLFEDAHHQHKRRHGRPSRAGSESGTLVNAPCITAAMACPDRWRGRGSCTDRQGHLRCHRRRQERCRSTRGSALFAHDIDRLHIALTRGAPHPAKGAIEGAIARSSHDRKKMALVKSGGRHAVTHYATDRTFGPQAKPLAARLACRLETGRTHQIRVHLASKGTPCLGDPTYGSGAPAAPVRAAIEAAGLTRQALHAAVLGFRHPVTGETVRFESPLPPDMADLEARLADL